MKSIVFYSSKLLLLIAYVTVFLSCKDKRNEKDITESVHSTTSVIDKNIQVSVDSGVVTLRGEVADEATKTAALNAVKHIEGVKSIESYLTVKAAVKAPQMSQQDIQLKAAIDSSLSLQGIHGVDITVSNGEVLLRGEVTRPQEIAIMKIAGDAHPAKLSNFLTVTDKEK
jgi:hyperosmotically inducible periplasmic protein